jgi:hypothetical protein
MPTVKTFTGLAPRVPRHLSVPGMASAALDVDLRSGSIRPWRSPRPLVSAGADAVTGRLLGNGCWVFWDRCVESTEYLPDHGRLYVTGRSARPEVADTDAAGLEYHWLGVPAPESAPSVSGGGGEIDRDCDARSYVYVYVNGHMESSAPSPPSAQVTVRDGEAVTVGGLAPPPEGWDVQAVAVYRSVTGERRTVEDMQAPASVWALAGVVPAGTASFTDGLLLRELGPALSTEHVRVPPQCLRKISHLEGTGILCGAEGNRLLFTEPFQPWNWPVEHELTFPYDIVTLGTMRTLGVLTTGAQGYVVEGAPPCSDGLQSRKVLEAVPAYPDLGCGRPHSAVMTPFGLVYSAKVGLVLLKPDASQEILTAPWYTPGQWQGLRPDTARLAWWEGTLFCATDAETLLLEIDPKTHGDGETGILTTASVRPDDMWTTDAGELMMLHSGWVWQWDAGTALMPYRWESTDLRMDGRQSPSSARVRTEGTWMTLRDTDLGGLYKRFVGGDRPFRLARLGRHRTYRLGFEGTGAVLSAEIGPSELAQEHYR